MVIKGYCRSDNNQNNVLQLFYDKVSSKLSCF